MKNLTILIVVAVSISSCLKIVDAIRNVDGSCWIDARAMILYYEAKDTMDGISIWLHDEKQRIEYDIPPGERGIYKVELGGLKERLLKQNVSISISRPNVHWRDDMRFYVSPEDWRKKRVIKSTHTYH